MKIDILTLFPDFFSSPLSESLLKKAIDKNLLTVNRIDIRSFSQNKHHKVDDYPYGGGQGMVMAVEPVVLAHESIHKEGHSKTIFLSPQGQLLTQEKAKSLASFDQLILLCGHYEGVDERAIDLVVDEEISIGDYILTGGELPALVLIDAISRHIDGVVGSKASVEEDSLSDGLLKYPQYTMPRSFRGANVPEVLLSGHHKNIENWRRELSLKRTKNKRPDLWASYNRKLEKEGK